MTYTYRTATWEDVPSLQKLGLASFGTFQGILSGAGWTKLEGNLNQISVYEALMEKSTGLVCMFGQQMVGMAFFIPSGNPTDIYPAEWCYVRMVGVHPDFGGKGIGKELMRQCLELARETQEKTIGLHTSEFMDAARHIYENMGFVRVKELEPRFEKRYWLYRLEI